MQGKPVAEQEIGKLLLLETVSYAESSMCRRKTLLHYFGEEYPEENCGCCDNCLHPKPKHRRPGVASHGAARRCATWGTSSRRITWPACWSVRIPR